MTTRSIQRVVLAAFVVLCTAAARADESGSTISSGPLCGVNTLYTALKAEGLELKFAELLKPQYVSSRAGSTFPELFKAAREHHAHAELLTSLGVADLASLKCPLILHVKNEYDAPDYNHFVLCVAAEDGKLALYDPPEPILRSSGHELAALWDGSALAVSAEPISLKALRLRATMRIALFWIAGIAAAGALALLRRWRTKTSDISARRFGAATQLAVLVGLTLCASFCYHVLAPEGFLAQRQAVVAIRNAHFMDIPGRIDLAQARFLLAQNIPFVDARDLSEYDQGHIHGAINLPPNASRLDREQTLSQFPQNAPLVVYCQSPSCPYAGLLARRLVRDGFSQVRVFTGGWTQWYEAEQARSAQPNQNLLSRVED